MIQRSLLAVVCALGACFAHQHSAASPSLAVVAAHRVNASIDDAILSADDRFWQAASDHDVTTIARLLADQYVGLTPDGTRWDKASVLTQHERVRTGELERTSDRTVIHVRDDAAVLTYEASFKIFDRGGGLLDTAHQRMASYWIRQDGNWRVIFAHVTSVPENT